MYNLLQVLNRSIQCLLKHITMDSGIPSHIQLGGHLT